MRWSLNATVTGAAIFAGKLRSSTPTPSPPLPPVSRKINGGIREFSMRGASSRKEGIRERGRHNGLLSLNGEKSPRGPRPSLTFPLSSIESNRVEFRSTVVIICSFYRYFFGLFSKIFRGDKLFTLETGPSWSDKGYKGRNFGNSLPSSRTGSKGYLIFSIIIFGKREWNLKFCPWFHYS